MINGSTCIDKNEQSKVSTVLHIYHTKQLDYESVDSITKFMGNVKLLMLTKIYTINNVRNT